MKKLILYAILLLGISLPSSARILSKDATIYVLTCSPGAELYSVFGHSAIRIKDQANKLDIVFNYGTFDFDTENFYIKYAQGLLPYQLSINSYKNFVASYVYENRSVYSQELLLDSLNRQKLFDALIENHQPENRTYLYNFLYDNCSTRIRDIIEDNNADSVVWNTANVGKNFWNLLDEYLSRMQWVKWGIHTILGQPGVREANTHEYMFLPDYLMNGLDSATVNGERLVGEIQVMYEAQPEEICNPWYCSPWFVFSLCTLLLIFCIQRFNTSWVLKGIALPLFLVTGLMGCLFIFLGYFTKHPITAPNLNLIWGNPLNLVVVPFLLKKKLPYYINTYLNYYAFILLLGIPAWFIALPAVPIDSLVLIVLMIYLSYKLKKL
ncbi:DUF4105 domain-containing protein [Odoribacter sp. OttesenSCG-928-A06]|nr:DUF4105 domain-containing protein [Odoribacter sp. OttesenSCG-928-A06]